MDDETETEDVPVVDQLYCYRDKDRVCGPECTAWITHPRDDKSPLEGVQRHCAVLSSAERTARHVTGIAYILGNADKKAKIAAQDKQRAEALKPPLPMDMGQKDPFGRKGGY